MFADTRISLQLARSASNVPGRWLQRSRCGNAHARHGAEGRAPAVTSGPVCLLTTGRRAQPQTLTWPRTRSFARVNTVWNARSRRLASVTLAVKAVLARPSACSLALAAATAPTPNSAKVQHSLALHCALLNVPPCIRHCLGSGLVPPWRASAPASWLRLPLCSEIVAQYHAYVGGTVSTWHSTPAGCRNACQ